MLKRRIIPCLDVKDGVVVKGIQFKGHEKVGEIAELATRYSADGADELVFYDISASVSDQPVSIEWVTQIAKTINIPFCVAGGIRSVAHAERILAAGADKISINSPAIENPGLIDELAKRFGVQCVVIGIDSKRAGDLYLINQYTGDPDKAKSINRETLDWAREAADRGAGEIVLNCMNQDGMRKGYDLLQIAMVTDAVSVPVIASGGAGEMQHFEDLFSQTKASGALAASVFHKNIIQIPELKRALKDKNIATRLI